MKTRMTVFVAAMFLSLATSGIVSAHCQIPCGIYDDELRVQLIEEHIGTVEKSMNLIRELSAAESVDFNQLIRWVVNKDDHATKIQDLVTEYFMAQRITKPANGGEKAMHEYGDQLMLLHQIQVAAMKSKQTTDQKYIDEMRDLVKKFRKAYFGEDASHSH